MRTPTIADYEAAHHMTAAEEIKLVAEMAAIIGTRQYIEEKAAVDVAYRLIDEAIRQRADRMSSWLVEESKRIKGY